MGLYNNMLTGSIPSAVGAMTSLMSLDFNTNKLSGTLPDMNLIVSRLTLLRLDGAMHCAKRSATV